MAATKYWSFVANAFLNSVKIATSPFVIETTHATAFPEAEAKKGVEKYIKSSDERAAAPKAVIVVETELHLTTTKDGYDNYDPKKKIAAPFTE